MINQLRKLFRAREILYLLAWRDIRIRYKQSVMGLLWAILLPSLVVGAAALVRVIASQWSGSQLDLGSVKSVMVRAVAWSLFIGGIRFGTNSLTGNGSLVTKIAFPKEVFPLAAVVSSLFDFLIALVAVVCVLLLFMHWTPGANVLWMVPLVLILAALTAGAAFILSAANLYFRDVKFLVEVFLTYAIFFTPVLYEASLVGEWRNLILLNPVAPLLEAMSATAIHNQAPDLAWTAYSAGVAVLLLVGGYALFKKLEAGFAEHF